MKEMLFIVVEMKKLNLLGWYFNNRDRAVEFANKMNADSEKEVFTVVTVMPMD